MGHPLYYLHIPKTAGTSLINFLDSQFDPSEICPAQLLPNLFGIGRSDLSQYRLFRGHLWHGLDSYLGRSLTYLTMLRDPVQRVVSWYSHVKREPAAYRHDRVVNENWSLLDFVRDEETNWDTINAQTLFLAVDLDYEQLARDPVGYGQGVVKKYAERGNDRALLKLAKARLEKFAFVGLSERMQDSLRLMCHTLGFYPVFQEQRLNVATNRPPDSELTSETVAAIKEITELDRELYDWASLVFEERLCAMTEGTVVRSKRSREFQNATAGWLAPLPEEQRSLLQLGPVTAPSHVRATSSFDAVVNLTNQSCFRISSRPPHPINLSYHWIDADSGEIAVFDGDRTSVVPELEAGQSAHKRVAVRAPDGPGKYLLRIALVQEGVAWFDYQPSPVCADFEVSVE